MIVWVDLESLIHVRNNFNVFFGYFQDNFKLNNASFEWSIVKLYILLSIVNKYSFMQSRNDTKVPKMQKKKNGFVLDPDPVLDPQYPRIRIWV